ncbi:hypothetical protein AAAC13_01370 [Pseudomonas aeruginosa]|uniref:hypothetical protein n=1 Tax=Pseudomonas aeruginosa group TaxID=136841 RepID=UPI000F831021|nr:MULTISPECIES: hypothetical protein [Pseudomonas aeruginosa group]EIU1445456.1 hypothetical protein [Pseudomonas aeruginosa]EKV2975681.1 hypothetical protein [Pseudomonas aeruginosa]EKV3160336.1 hypothetical protein [Pseudomonas aeruginosa]EKW6212550.1 hypothetical protein [Pseudomonas aeruginosa]EKW7604450.1 hypothetical protein [Pseudomonas aeruginosa]
MPQASSLQATAERVCSLIGYTPIERGDQVEAFVTEFTPGHALISFGFQGGVVQGHLTLTLQSIPPRIWVRFPIPGHEAVPMPGDGVGAQAANLAGLVREQMARRPPVSERFKGFLARRDLQRAAQEA